jgi:hypothetical protein
MRMKFDERSIRAGVGGMLAGRLRPASARVAPWAIELPNSFLLTRKKWVRAIAGVVPSALTSRFVSIKKVKDVIASHIGSRRHLHAQPTC